MKNELDVLIVGAGPAGLSLAFLLHQQKIKVRLIDKDSGPTEATRAPVVWQRTQEILGAMGIRDHWLESGHEMKEESLHFYGAWASGVPMEDIRSIYERPIFQSQSFTENALRSALESSGLSVEYGNACVSYEEISGSGEVTTDNGEVIRAKWVVAAEGSKSVIRNSVGLDYPGERYEGFRIHVADVNINWTLPSSIGQGYFFIEEKVYLGGQRLPGDPNRFYFYILTPDEQPNYEGHDVGIEQIQALVRRFSKDDQACITKLHWGTTARYRHGVADKFRSGQAILLGDSARIFIPLYGQGMNYAIHDAWNLAWKLSATVKGLATESLLQTYEEERRAAAIDLDKKIDRTFRLITEPKILQASALRTLAPKVLASETAKHFAMRNFTEIDLGYVGVGMSKDTSKLGNLKSGMRAPMLWAKSLPSCDSVNLLSLYDGGKFTLLLVHKAKADTAKMDSEISAALQLEREFSTTLKLVRLMGGPKRPELELATWVDAEERFASGHELPDTCAILVRPDGYIAHVTKSVADGTAAYLRKWIVGNSVSE